MTIHSNMIHKPQIIPANPFNKREPYQDLMQMRPAIPNEIAIEILKYLPFREAHQVLTLTKSQMWMERLEYDRILLNLNTSLTLKELRQCQRMLSSNVKNDGFLVKAPLQSLTELNIHLENLKELDCSNQHDLTDQELREIVQLCPKLTSINLTRCKKISDAGILAIAECCPKLTSIQLTECPITDGVVQTLAEHCHELKTLCLYGCDRLTDDALNSLAKNCPNITSLDLFHCQNITDRGIVALSEHCPNITSIDLSKCDVTDYGLDELASHCSHLVRMVLWDCGLLTEDDVEELKENYPYLNVMS